MTTLFTCPSCGAPLEEPDGFDPTIRCPYCNANVIVPEELRTPKIINVSDPGTHQTKVIVNLTPGNFPITSRSISRPKTGWILTAVALIIIVSLIVTIIPIVAVPFAILSVFKQPAIQDADIQIRTPVSTATQPAATATPGYLTEILKFGSEGNGAGMFTDIRGIAVDGEGNIYTAEYLGGRIQMFDASGKFVTQWLIDDEFPVLSISASREGIVYIVQKGEITAYEGKSGKKLNSIFYKNNSFDYAKITLDGGLITSSIDQTDDIVRFSSSGDVILEIKRAISEQGDKSELDIHAVEDGNGNIYALGGFNQAVFKFSRDGKFITRIGSPGDSPGQFRAVQSLAVDNTGKLFVSDFRGIQIFNTDGLFITSFETNFIASDLVFDEINSLYIAARTEVYKFKINQK